MRVRESLKNRRTSWLTMIKKSEATEDSSSAQWITRSEGTKWRFVGKDVITSLNREQSSRTRYFLQMRNKCEILRGNIKLLQTYLSSSSTTSPTGVHSNTIIPGKPGVLEPLEGDSGIAKTDSETQDPDSGISNLRSSQMAVASLSGFKDSQMFHGSRNVEWLIFCTCFLMTLRKDPCAQRCSCSCEFYENVRNGKAVRSGYGPPWTALREPHPFSEDGNLLKFFFLLSS
jgi:hypothetical protein